MIGNKNIHATEVKNNNSICQLGFGVLIINKNNANKGDKFIIKNNPINANALIFWKSKQNNSLSVFVLCCRAAVYQLVAKKAIIKKRTIKSR